MNSIENNINISLHVIDYGVDQTILIVFFAHSPFKVLFPKESDRKPFGTTDNLLFIFFRIGSVLWSQRQTSTGRNKRRTKCNSIQHNNTSHIHTYTFISSARTRVCVCVCSPWQEQSFKLNFYVHINIEGRNWLCTLQLLPLNPGTRVRFPPRPNFFSLSLSLSHSYSSLSMNYKFWFHRILFHSGFFFSLRSTDSIRSDSASIAA